MIIVAAAVLVGSTPWSCDQEDSRIRGHLGDALTQLRTAPPVGLRADQRAARAEVIALLERYVAESKFPRTRGEAGPVFVDEAGTHCAMGALIAATGGSAIVERIHESRNLETVGTLADEPGVEEWLEAHGMTAEEAALVQPTYFECLPPIVHCRTRQSSDWLIMTPRGEEGDATPFRVPAGQCHSELANFHPLRIQSFREEIGEVPAGSLFSEKSHRFATIDGELPLDVSSCGHRLVMTPAALAAKDPTECAKTLMQSDLRWLIPVCASRNSGAGVAHACHPNGRRISQRLPTRGGGLQYALEESDWFEDAFPDAGVTPEMFAAAEAMAWDESDDGGALVQPPDRSGYVLWAEACPGDAGLSVGTNAAVPGCSSTGTDGVFLFALFTLLARSRTCSNKRRLCSARIDPAVG